MMPPDFDDETPGVLPELFTHCPRCGGGKAEPYGSLRYGQPCDTCYGMGTVLTAAGLAVQAVIEWREKVAHNRSRNHPMYPDTWTREYSDSRRAEGTHPYFRVMPSEGSDDGG